MSRKLVVINGPNLNLLGVREPDLYGSQTLADIENLLQERFPEVEWIFFQSNVEGEIINHIQQVGFSADGIIINAGGYSHTSVAIADALRSVTAPAVEVHLSNIFAREAYRHDSLTAQACKGSISGLGAFGYIAAAEYLLGR
ncbi:MAG: hypothetical protein RL220_1706 [Bacteroidota bacterium]